MQILDNRKIYNVVLHVCIFKFIHEQKTKVTKDHHTVHSSIISINALKFEEKLSWYKIII